MYIQYKHTNKMGNYFFSEQYNSNLIIAYAWATLHSKHSLNLPENLCNRLRTVTVYYYYVY